MYVSLFQIYEAIEMFDVKMLKEDRVHPTRYTFTTLIGILGRAGYTKKAFKLYNQVSVLLFSVLKWIRPCIGMFYMLCVILGLFL